MIDALATGRPLGPRLADLATTTGQLTARQVRLVGGMLEELDRLTTRQAALEVARRELARQVGRNSWHLALALESRLKRFEAVGYRRILATARQPTALELAMSELLTTSRVRCARKLWSELRSLPEPGQ